MLLLTNFILTVIRYVCHSSFGYDNCYIITKYVRGGSRIGLFAKRNIKKYEELYFDYQVTANVGWLLDYNRHYKNMVENN